MSDDELLALLAWHVEAPSRRRAVEALRQGSTIDDLLRAEPPGREARRLAQQQSIALKKMGIRVRLGWLPPLVQVADVPLLVFVRGAEEVLSTPAVSIVGSRRAGRGNLAWAAAVARREVGQGQVIVSGGALGIDGAAHRAALEAGGRTVVYLGVGADKIYPTSHKMLFARVLERGGALVSEYPPGASTPSYGHARRNRFIAAHGAQLYVAEAAASSGSLGTVRAALALGRPVLVPPASVGGVRSGIDPLLEAGQAQVHLPG